VQNEKSMKILKFSIILGKWSENIKNIAETAAEVAVSAMFFDIFLSLLKKKRLFWGKNTLC
jgi:hypothetical protein